MNEIDKPLLELVNLLRTIESNIKKSKPNTILMVQKGKNKDKTKTKSKGKAKAKPTQSISTLKPK